MPVTNMGAEKRHKVSEMYHKVNEAKIDRSNPSVDDATEKILRICGCLQSIMTVKNI